MHLAPAISSDRGPKLLSTVPRFLALGENRMPPLPHLVKIGGPQISLTSMSTSEGILLIC